MEQDLGRPFSIRTDNGSEFINSGFQAYLKAKDIKHILSSANRPETNGQVERLNGIVKRGLSMYRMQTGSRDWVGFLPQFVDNYNHVWQRTIQMTPAEALQINDADIAEIRNRIRAEITPKNAGLDNRVFRVGDTVRLKLINEGFSKGVSQGGTNWSRETYTVSHVTEPTESTERSYRVSTVGGEKLTEILYGNDLLLVKAIENDVQAPMTYTVQRLIRPALRNGEQGYIVKWKGYSYGEATFEPRTNLLEDVPKIVRRFEEEKNVKWFADRFTWTEKK